MKKIIVYSVAMIVVVNLVTACFDTTEIQQQSNARYELLNNI